MSRADLPTVPLAVTVGQFLLLALPADGPGLVLGETALIATLVASLALGTPRRVWPSVAAAGLVAGAGLAATGVLAAAATDGTALWAVALALAAVGSLASYGLHRYELLAVGLVGPDAEPSTEGGS